MDNIYMIGTSYYTCLIYVVIWGNIHFVKFPFLRDKVHKYSQLLPIYLTLHLNFFQF